MRKSTSADLVAFGIYLSVSLNLKLPERVGYKAENETCTLGNIFLCSPNLLFRKLSLFCLHDVDGSL